MSVANNVLYYGDNLDVLRRYVNDESVDLVYLDPPFNSNADYNVLFSDHGTKASAQIKAFEDTWRWDESAARAFQEVVMSGGKVADCMRAFQTLLGSSDMLAYLAMMAPRLVELRRALKATGSTYLHCDPTASHYLKLLMDSVFGPEHLRNEIIWKRTTAHSSAKRYAPVHDTILYYSRSRSPTWTAPREDYEPAYLDRYYRFDDGDGRLYWRADLTGAGRRNGATGQPWRGIDPGVIGRHWMVPPEELEELDGQGRIYWPKRGTMPQYKRYRDELKGKAVSDLWTDIDRINPVGAERLGYPTQKPVALLERIIESSSRAGDTVLDPFCGCGTTIDAAQRLNRAWIGIDVTHLAVGLIKHRLRDAHGLEAPSGYDVVGEPTDLSGAEELARSDPYQFQWWALGLVGARPAEGKKGADKGIDGRIFFFDEGPSASAKQIILSVKAGKVGVAHVRDLRGVVERESAAMGVLLSLEQATGPMRVEASTAGFYDSPWDGLHPRIQLLTIYDLLDLGHRIDAPPLGHVGATFKQAPRTEAPQGQQQTFGV
ncbi:MAG: restriction endonuclease [Actinobacteria bacterium]|nr:restriction endonuclease [Actinomycetota bacterium]